MSFRRSRSLGRSSKRKYVKRSRSAGRLGGSKYARSKVVSGYTRNSGFYGRFSAPSKRPESKFLDLSMGGNAPQVTGGYMTGLSGAAEPTLISAWVNVANSPNAYGQLCDHICHIPQNSLPTGRIGRKVFLKSMAAHLTFSFNATANVGSITYEIYVVQDTQTNGAQCTKEDIWANTVLTVGPPDNLGRGLVDHNSFYNLANEGRFNILYSKRLNITLPQAGNAASSVSYRKDHDFFVPCGFPLEYDQSTAFGGISTCRANSLHLFIASQNSLGSGIGNVAGTVRLRYTDI